MPGGRIYASVLLEQDNEVLRLAAADGVSRGWFKDSIGSGQVEFRMLPSGDLDGRWRWGDSGPWNEGWDVQAVANEPIPDALSKRLADDGFCADVWQGD